MPKRTKKSARLPKSAIPTRYEITIHPDLDNFTFKGEETVHVRVPKKTKTITLHSADLEILSAEFASGKKALPAKVIYNEKDETATLSFASFVPAGAGKLVLSFTGILNDKMRGFYRSKYEYGGKEAHMAVTQFESTDARRAFPCFDEPAHKAVFEVSLVVPEDRTALSNMLETEIAEHSPGYKVVKFAPSPKMSSYLLAFIIGHFEHIQGKTKSGILVRVFTTPGKKHQAKFALDCAIKCIEFYEKYFAIRYPLPVMDLIAIPDFAAGAMENWGAVTYRETAVLVDPVHSSLQNRQRVAMVIAHELAHQWFGNLVTMEWWTHLWLNEGFASYMEFVALDAVYPKWNMWSHFVADDQNRAFQLDALRNTHAIEIDVNHPSEISEIFDAVSYSKGASVIRMLASYLGETDFRNGLRAYLKKHAYGNALTEDLWKALGRASGKPVAEMMRIWTRKPGYPVVSVSRTEKGIAVSQKRFLPDIAPGKKDPTVWRVPLSFKGPKGASKPVLFSARSAAYPWKQDGYIKANPNETVFARIQYDVENLKALAEEIGKKKTSLTETERYGIVRDAFAFAKSGVSSTPAALGLLTAYRNEESYIVWSEVISNLLELKQLLHGTKEAESYARFALSIVEKKAREIGWQAKKGEHPDMAFLRNALLNAAGSFGDKATVEKANALFKNRSAKNGHIDPSIRASVYKIVAENGNEKEYDSLFEEYLSSNLEEEKDRLMRALSSFKQEKLLLKTLSYAFSEKSRGQDALKAVSFTWANPYGRRVAWEYLSAHWDDIKRRFEGGHLFSRFIAPASFFTEIDEANEIRAFFAKHPSLGITRTVAQAVEQIRSKAGWYARDAEKISGFLAGN
jgi:puromycin-sensitive aminopeptidase